MSTHTVNDFVGESTSTFNKCHKCKCYFTGAQGRVFCKTCAPTVVLEDQPELVDIYSQ